MAKRTAKAKPKAKQKAAKKPVAKKSASKSKPKPKAKPKRAVKAKPKAATKPKPKAPPKPKASIAAAPSDRAGNRDQLQREILEMARELYGPEQTDAQLLALDPNDIDEMDPSIFYELIGERYGVEADSDNDYFGGFGGPISKLIDFVAKQWDGRTNKTTEMPPGEWLGDFVHPAATKATEAAPPPEQADEEDQDYGEA